MCLCNFGDPRHLIFPFLPVPSLSLPFLPFPFLAFSWKRNERKGKGRLCLCHFGEAGGRKPPEGTHSWEVIITILIFIARIYCIRSYSTILYYIINIISYFNIICYLISYHVIYYCDTFYHIISY